MAGHKNLKMFVVAFCLIVLTVFGYDRINDIVMRRIVNLDGVVGFHIPWSAVRLTYQKHYPSFGQGGVVLYIYELPKGYSLSCRDIGGDIVLSKLRVDPVMENLSSNYLDMSKGGCVKSIQNGGVIIKQKQILVIQQYVD